MFDFAAGGSHSDVPAGGGWTCMQIGWLMLQVRSNVHVGNLCNHPFGGGDIEEGGSGGAAGVRDHVAFRLRRIAGSAEKASFQT